MYPLQVPTVTLISKLLSSDTARVHYATLYCEVYTYSGRNQGFMQYALTHTYTRADCLILKVKVLPL